MIHGQLFPQISPISQIRPRTGNRDSILIDKFSIQITRRDIERLRGENLLNDQLINFYFALLNEKYYNVFCFDTFFSVLFKMLATKE